MFFSRKEKENPNEDLKNLQELTAKLEELKNQKENLSAPPAYQDYDDIPRSKYSWQTCGRQREHCETIAWYMTQASMRQLEPFDFIRFIRGSLPQKGSNYLKNWGEYLIMISNLFEHQEKLSLEISETEKEIKELKTKLHIC